MRDTARKLGSGDAGALVVALLLAPTTLLTHRLVARIPVVHARVAVVVVHAGEDEAEPLRRTALDHPAELLQEGASSALQPRRDHDAVDLAAQGHRVAHAQDG